MVRQILRTVVGALMVWAGLHLMSRSVEKVKEIISPPPPAYSDTLPVRPAELLEEPAAKAKIEETVLMNRAGIVIACTGGLLALSGAMPLAVWLLFGPARLNRGEQHDPANPPAPGGAGDDLGGDMVPRSGPQEHGSLGEAAQPDPGISS